MRGTEKIIAHIRADAQAQADAVIAEAEKKYAEIARKYKAKSEELYKAKINAGVKETSDISDSRERIFQMEIKKDILALKQQMVAKVFDRAREMVLALPREDYIAFLVKLVKNASLTGDETVILNARDRAELGADFIAAANAAIEKGALTLSEECGSFAGGLVMRRGSIDVNCTVELLTDLCRSEMSSQIAEKLFEK